MRTPILRFIQAYQRFFLYFAPIAICVTGGYYGSGIAGQARWLSAAMFWLVVVTLLFVSVFVFAQIIKAFLSGNVYVAGGEYRWPNAIFFTAVLFYMTAFLTVTYVDWIVAAFVLRGYR